MANTVAIVSVIVTGVVSPIIAATAARPGLTAETMLATDQGKQHVSSNADGRPG